MFNVEKNKKLINYKFIVLYATIIGLLAVVYYINFLSVSASLGGLFDYGSFIASGQLANAEKNPYSIDSPLINKVSFPEIGIEGVAPNLNPPVSILFFQWLAKFDPLYSIMVWRIFNVFLFIIAIFLLNRIYPVHGFQAFLRIFWAFSLAGIWHTIRLGQIYGVLLLLTVLIWLFSMKGRLVWAGIFLGMLIAIKPNFIFWALLFLIAGNWRTFLSSAITALCISIIPVFPHGFVIYKQWIEAVSLYTPDLLIFPGNNSLQGLTSRFFTSSEGIVLSIFVCVYVMMMVIKNKPPTTIVSSLGIISSLLISPIAWTGYTLMALPIFFENLNWIPLIKIAAIIFSIPFAIVIMLFTNSYLNFILFGWFYGWGLLCLVAWLIYDSWKASRNSLK